MLKVVVRELKEYRSIRDLGAWSGGEETLQRVIESDKIKELDELINKTFEEDAEIEHSILNKWLWTKRDEIFTKLGIEK